MKVMNDGASVGGLGFVKSAAKLLLCCCLGVIFVHSCVTPASAELFTILYDANTGCIKSCFKTPPGRGIHLAGSDTVACIDVTAGVELSKMRVLPGVHTLVAKDRIVVFDDIGNPVEQVHLSSGHDDSVTLYVKKLDYNDTLSVVDGDGLFVTFNPIPRHLWTKNAIDPNAMQDTPQLEDRGIDSSYGKIINHSPRIVRGYARVTVGSLREEGEDRLVIGERSFAGMPVPAYVTIIYSNKVMTK